MAQDRALLTEDFQTDPLARGWVATPGEGGPPPAWTDACSHSGGHCLWAEGGWWESPLLPVAPFEYYRLAFHSRARARGMWAAVFRDAAGRDLDADHYSGFDASDDWSANEFCFRAKATATHARIRFQPTPGSPIWVDDVSVAPIDRPGVARWADAVYARMPPLAWSAPDAPLARLPQTVARLEGGGTLRVVMLGDSIVNDTGNSAFDVLVERARPGLRMEVVTSVRGGTGCWYYQEPTRVREYVLDFRPDLLMIGGISHKGDTEAVRGVIRQVRQAQRPDILLMTGAFGRDDPRTDPNWTPQVDPAADDYRAHLLRLADEEQAEFLDLTGPWGRYIRESDEPYAWFMRDEVHANARGRQVLARILERYFGA